jgi:hypothetical protein
MKTQHFKEILYNVQTNRTLRSFNASYVRRERNPPNRKSQSPVRWPKSLSTSSAHQLRAFSVAMPMILVK